MSVSIAMIPVALTLRVVMGKEKFNEWIESSQLRVPTTFKNKSELIKIVKKSGYDAIKFGNSIKTHRSKRKHDYFLWQKREGTWVAVFSKYDEEEILKKLIEKIEATAGREIFLEPEEVKEEKATEEEEVEGNVKTKQKNNLLQKRKLSKTNNKKTVTSKMEKVFPTNFRDQDLLIQTLREYKANPVLNNDGTIQCQMGKTSLEFDKIDNLYEVKITTDKAELRSTFNHLSNIDTNYKHTVQANTYQNMKEKIEEKDYTIEEEEVLEDNSIMITLNV